MRSLIITIAILIYILPSSAQNNIRGFGSLELGISIADLPELTKAISITKSDQYYKLVYGNTSKNSYELVCDTNERYPIGSYDSRVREFQIGNYNITETIQISDITLKFFNDKLYSIDVKGNKLKEPLTVKYGEGKLTTKEKEHTFQNGYGAKFVKTDRTFTTTWDTGNPNIICRSVLMSWFNDKGVQNIINYTLLHDESHDDDIKKTSDIIKDRIAKRIETQKKKELSGF